MSHGLAALLAALLLMTASCAPGLPPTPTKPPPLATAEAVVAAARSAVPTTPTPRETPVKQGRSREDPAPAGAGVALDGGYVVFAKVMDNDAAERVRGFNPANPAPGAGRRYVSVTVVMSSGQQDGKSLPVSSAEFGLIGASGAKFKPLTTLGAKGLDGEMQGGRQLFGELVFEVPKEEQAQLLSYEPAGRSGVQYFLALAAS